jgi:RNA ligase (TIGR02306 family)
MSNLTNTNAEKGNEEKVRPLAYVTTVRELCPIEGADRIELATVLGWKVVVGKGQYKVGDRIIYFEIDSLLPKWDVFKDLKKTKYRIRTIKLRGVYSNGYCSPLDVFTEDNTMGFVKSDGETLFYKESIESSEFEEIPLVDGTDITEALHVKKWEILDDDRFNAGKPEGYRPGYVRKTDQTRIQNLPEYFEKYPELEFEVSEKLEGSSLTVHKKTDEFSTVTGVCGRNMGFNLEDENSVAVQLVKKLGVIEKLNSVEGSYALQGEIIGPGIQGNIYGLSEFQWRIYDVFNIYQQKYLAPSERMKVLKEMGLEDLSVPILGTIKLKDFTLDSLLEYADGKSVLNKHVYREGLVFKSLEPANVNYEVITFKTISNKYLAGK